MAKSKERVSITFPTLELNHTNGLPDLNNQIFKEDPLANFSLVDLLHLWYPKYFSPGRALAPRTFVQSLARERQLGISKPIAVELCDIMKNMGLLQELTNRSLTTTDHGKKILSEGEDNDGKEEIRSPALNEKLVETNNGEMEENASIIPILKRKRDHDNTDQVQVPSTINDSSCEETSESEESSSSSDSDSDSSSSTKSHSDESSSEESSSDDDSSSTSESSSSSDSDEESDGEPEPPVEPEAISSSQKAQPKFTCEENEAKKPPLPKDRVLLSFSLYQNILRKHGNNIISFTNLKKFGMMLERRNMCSDEIGRSRGDHQRMLRQKFREIVDEITQFGPTVDRQLSMIQGGRRIRKRFRKIAVRQRSLNRLYKDINIKAAGNFEALDKLLQDRRANMQPFANSTSRNKKIKRKRNKQPRKSRPIVNASASTGPQTRNQKLESEMEELKKQVKELQNFKDAPKTIHIQVHQPPTIVHVPKF